MSYKNKIKDIAGYTIDQTILIVAVIAILVTLIISTVGWSILSRASGTKLASYLDQISNSLQSFYVATNMWPDTALEKCGWTINAWNKSVILQRPISNSCANSNFTYLVTDHVNYLTGLTYDTNSKHLQHPFGSRGDILIDAEQFADTSSATTDFKGEYYVVEFENVPSSDALQVKAAYDGDSDEAFTRGRIFLVASQPNSWSCSSDATQLASKSIVKTAKVVDLCFVARQLN